MDTEHEDAITEEKKELSISETISKLEALQDLHNELYSNALVGIASDYIQVDASFFKKTFQEDHLEATWNGENIRIMCVHNGRRYLTIL